MSLFTTAVAFATVAQIPVELPEGQGKTILEASCVSCHGLDVLAKKEGLQADSLEAHAIQGFALVARHFGYDSIV